MKKSIKIIVAGIVSVSVLGFAFYWNHPAHIYGREISQLRKIYLSDSQNSITPLLDRTSAGGDWGKLERAVKDYVRNRLESLSTLEEIQSDEELNTALDADKLRANAPEFKDILTKLKNAKTTFETAREKYNKVKTIDAAVEQIGNELNDEFKNRYREELGKDFADEDSHVNYADAFKMIQGMLDTYIAELELLAKYPKAWNADGKEIKFSDSSVKKQYYDILEKVKTIK
ncbi:hypothetical protein IKF25_01760 [Candidatus Saccharibacteria bacterium]|jgi:hypothetical protein|nr:hypothetical protein [Candidatus Saccharibacteria bacterium]